MEQYVYNSGEQIVFGTTWSFSGMALSSTFTWHPILMSIGFPCLMMLGRWAYVSDEIGDKETQRSVHRGLMMLATLIAIAGYVA